ncbi:hypothetical protein Ga0074812_10819 [Parafrankia irregularis]|uniref:Uncharacterized protein n=1 Tax=Parafrankia irregularis TaxID=795642 RepID=A0A0S4QLF0_9ACTN|nr:hypothetical protein Ga0074812_10819 [Parafrankia irregularis]
MTSRGTLDDYPEPLPGTQTGQVPPFVHQQELAHYSWESTVSTCTPSASRVSGITENPGAATPIAAAA